MAAVTRIIRFIFLSSRPWRVGSDKMLSVTDDFSFSAAGGLPAKKTAGLIEKETNERRTPNPPRADPILMALRLTYF